MPFGRELDLLEAYLGIEQVRFHDRLVVTIDVPDDVRDTPVPPFLLQPIVENAIKHAVAPSGRAGLHHREGAPHRGARPHRRHRLGPRLRARGRRPARPRAGARRAPPRGARAVRRAARRAQRRRLRRRPHPAGLMAPCA